MKFALDRRWAMRGTAELPQHGIKRRDMGRGGAAAAADQVQAIFDNKALHPGSEFFRAQRVMGFAIHQFWQASIGLAGNQPRPVLRQPAHMLRHFLRAGRTIQPHQRHVQGIHNGCGGGDIGADQQRAGGFHRDLHENRNVRPRRLARYLARIHRGLDEKRVLIGFCQQRIRTTRDQPTALFHQRRFQRVISYIAKAWQLGARADIAHHPTMPAIGEAISRFARQFHRKLVDFKSALFQFKFGKRHRRTAEAIGQHHIGARFVIAAVNVAHDIGARKVQHFRAVFLAPVITFHFQGHGLHAATHAAITQQYAVTKGVEEMRARHGETFRKRGWRQKAAGVPPTKA